MLTTTETTLRGNQLPAALNEDKNTLFLRKNAFFCQNIWSIHYAGYALAFNDTLVPSDAACWKAILISLYSNEFSNIPPKLRSQNAAYTHFFTTKIHFFLKKFAYMNFLLYLCSRFRNNEIIDQWYKGYYVRFWF